MAAEARRFKEIGPEAQALIDRLVADKQARYERRPQLVFVYIPDRLSAEERELLRAARSAARQHLSDQRARREEREAQQRALGRQRTAIRKQQAARREWLRQNARAYSQAEGWQRVAWREACDMGRLPPIVRAIPTAVGVVVFLVLFVRWMALIGPAVLGGLSALAVSQTETLIERRIVARRARLLIAQFEEARKQSRRIPKDVRRAVLTRDGSRCVYCGACDDLHIDHVHPWSRGGPSEVANLQTLCAPCNIRKGARSDAEARARLTPAARQSTPGSLP